MTIRPDHYALIHKALRANLFETAALVARTDFSLGEEIRTTLAALARTLRLLRTHAEHEEEFVQPLLRAVAPELADSLDGEHLDIEALHTDIDHLMARAVVAAPPDRQALVRALTWSVNRLVGRHVLHMDREEREGNAVFWDHYTDAEMGAVQGRIAAAVPAEAKAELAQILLPAITPAERAEFLRAVQQPRA